jgi:hypothetical protein
MPEDSLQEFLLSVTQNRERARMTSGADLRKDQAEWNTMVFATSNRALSTSVEGEGDAQDAARNRVIDLEINGEYTLQNAPDSDVLALKLGVREHTGYIGAAIALHIAQNKARFVAMFQAAMQAEHGTEYLKVVRACALVGANILRELYPHHWTIEETDMADIISRMIRDAEGTQNAAKERLFNTPEEAVLDLIAYNRDSTIVILPRRGRGNGVQLVRSNGTPVGPQTEARGAMDNFADRSATPNIRVDAATDPSSCTVYISASYLQFLKRNQAPQFEPIVSAARQPRYAPPGGARQHIDMLDGTQIGGVRSQSAVIALKLHIPRSQLVSKEDAQSSAAQGNTGERHAH